MKRFYFTNENFENVGNDHVGNLRGAKTQAQKIADEIGESVTVNDFDTEDIICFVYPKER